MPKFVSAMPDDEKPLVVSTVIGDEDGEVQICVNDWVVGSFRGDGVFELAEARGLDEDLDKILDSDGFIKVREEGTTKLMK